MKDVGEFPKAADFIHQASQLLKPRGQTHGEGWMLEAGALWTAYLEGRTIDNASGNELTDKDVAICMALAKIARIRSGKFNKDNFIDAANYMALAGEYGYDEECERRAQGDFPEEVLGTVTGRWSSEPDSPIKPDPSEVRTEDDPAAIPYRQALALLYKDVRAVRGNDCAWMSFKNAKRVLGLE